MDQLIKFKKCDSGDVIKYIRKWGLQRYEWKITKELLINVTNGWSIINATCTKLNLRSVIK